jgi:hypothetical protein
MTEPTSEEIAEADARRRVREEERAKLEFEKPGWSEWRVYSWIAYRNRSLICEVEDRRDLRMLRRRYGWHKYPELFATYSEFQSAALRQLISKRESLLDKRPNETLLRALQADKLKAYDSGGREIPADYWVFKEAGDIATVAFRRADVLRIWPDQGGVSELLGPATSGASEDENKPTPVCRRRKVEAVKGWFDINYPGGSIPLGKSVKELRADFETETKISISTSTVLRALGLKR